MRGALSLVCAASALCLTLCFGSPVCAAWAAQTGDAHVPEHTRVDEAEARLSVIEALNLAGLLTAAGQTEEARQILTTLLQSPRLEIRLEALFLLGNLYAREENYGEAIKIYQSILENHPNLARIRLELARAYFDDEDYERADFHFRLAQGDANIPPDVREKIDAFLGAIRRQKNWSLSGMLGIVPDSNLNGASGETRECIRTVYGLLCRDLEDEKSGVGLRSALNGSYYLRLGRNAGLKASAGFSILDFSENRFDDNSIRLALGPRFMAKSGEISLQPLYSKRWAGGKDYSSGLGFTLDSSYDLTRTLMLESGFSWINNRYDTPFINDILKGHTSDAYLDLRYVLTAKSFVAAGASYSDDVTNQHSYGSRSFGGNISYFAQFPWGITAYARLAWTRSAYKEARWYITADSYIEDKRRKDGIWQGSLRLSNRHWEYLGFTPALSYIYINRNSNVWNYDYDRHRVEISLRQVF